MGLGYLLHHGVDAGLQLGSQGFRCLRGTGSPPNSPNIFQDVTQVLGIQGEDLGLFGKRNAQLGHLASRQGSNIAYSLGQKEVRLGRHQCCLIGVVEALCIL